MEYAQPVYSISQAETKNNFPNREKLLYKLDESLSNPLHHRLINAYAHTDTNSAKESMELELASILLEVLDHEN